MNRKYRSRHIVTYTKHTQDMSHPTYSLTPFLFIEGNFSQDDIVSMVRRFRTEPQEEQDGRAEPVPQDFRTLMKLAAEASGVQDTTAFRTLAEALAKAMVPAANTELEKAKAHIKELISDVDDVRIEGNRRIEELKELNRELKRKVDEANVVFLLEENKARISDQRVERYYDQVQDLLGERDQLIVESKDLRERVAVLNRKRSELEESLSQKDSDRQSMEAQIQELTAHVDYWRSAAGAELGHGLQQSIETTHGTIVPRFVPKGASPNPIIMPTACHPANGSGVNLRDRVKQLEEENRTLQDKVEHANVTVESMEGRIKHQSEILTQRWGRIEELLRERDALKKQLEDAGKEKEELEGAVQRFSSLNKKISSNASHMQETIADLKKQLAEKEGELRKLAHQSAQDAFRNPTTSEEPLEHRSDEVRRMMERLMQLCEPTTPK